MIDTGALRDKILYLAVTGKLVSQDEKDIPAGDLVKKLAGEIVIEPCKDISDDELPYNELPVSWHWCRLSDIGTTNIGLTYHPENIKDDGTIVLRSNNIQNGKFDYSDLVKVDCDIRDNQFIGENDILICARNGSKALVGKCAIYDGRYGKVSFGAFMAIYRTVCYQYVYYYLQTPLFRRYFSNDDTKQINQVTQAILKKAVIPLPPFEEQERIVQRIEEIFSVLSQLDDLQTRYASDRDVLKGKLIDAAICGKLTKQLPEDGTAEELYQQIQEEKKRLEKEGKLKKSKKLPEITEDEIPFDIPANWKWVRICDIFDLQSGKNITASDIYDDKTSEHHFPCYGGNGLRGFVSESNRCGDFALIGRQGALCGNINFAHGDFYATEHAVVVNHFGICDYKWTGMFLNALNLNQYATATAQPGLAVGKINKVLIPLPPLNEQERIVNCLDSLFVNL